MILSEVDEFADALALSTAGTALILVGDVMDLGAGPNPLYDIDNLYLVITIDTAVTSGGAASVTFTLASDAQAAIAVDGSATVHWTGGAVAKATLVAGYVYGIVQLPKQPLYERYLGILQQTSTTVLTAGKFNAFLTRDPSNWKAMTDGIQ